MALRPVLVSNVGDARRWDAAGMASRAKDPPLVSPMNDGIDVPVHPEKQERRERDLHGDRSRRMPLGKTGQDIKQDTCTMRFITPDSEAMMRIINEIVCSAIHTRSR